MCSYANILINLFCLCNQIVDTNLYVIKSLNQNGKESDHGPFFRD